MAPLLTTTVLNKRLDLPPMGRSTMYARTNPWTKSRSLIRSHEFPDQTDCLFSDRLAADNRLPGTGTHVLREVGGGFVIA